MSIMWAILTIRERRSAAVKCWAKLLPFGINCRLQLAGLGKKWGETVNQPALACFMLKATSVPQTPQTNHSQYSSPVEALNLIVDSKSQPVELDNSAIELHVPSGRKKRLLSLFCGFWFPCFKFDMTFDVTLRDDSSFGKLTHSCN